MIEYPIHTGTDALEKLSLWLKSQTYSQIVVLVDENTREHCYPLLKPMLPRHSYIEISSGEVNKNLDTCTRIWEFMTEGALDRQALMINLGGGVIGDMGGFVAGTYKRGIDFVQVPTTLLSQVDASVGSKLGIDFQGFKNHIGLFRDPQGVYIYPLFLTTLSDRELASGFAEVIKHHLIADKEAWKSLKSQTQIRHLDFEQLIRHSINIKSQIVESDPFEKGPRKALNFGHTVGHALESFKLESTYPLLHGEAIAVGMICESYLSFQRGYISEQDISGISQYILHIYPKVAVQKDHFTAISSLAINDKKNRQGKILCTLLNQLGDFLIDQEIGEKEITQSLDFYRKL